MDVGTLVLHRFNGVEIFALKSATITATEADGAVRLLLYVNTKQKPIQSLPDTAEHHPWPNAEVYLTRKKLDVSRLVGRRFSVPAAYSEAEETHVACLYYFDHGDLSRNVVRFLERRGNQFLVHWTGTTPDVNSYDGRKPATKVDIKGWFTFQHLRRWEKARATPGPR